MKRDWVVDASAVAGLFLPDESSSYAEALLASGSRWIVSELWWFELANVLTVSFRRGRLHVDELERCVQLLSEFPLETARELSNSDGLRMVTASARANQLSGYDASYLVLARQRGLGIATIDEPLVKAATRLGVQVFKP